jgi:Cu(I)/Ag(I) efflux system membrane protein CusA/SilA
MVARIIDFCARNRFLVLLFVLFASVGAAYSIRHVSLDAIPDLSDPQVVVFTEWTGRNPTLIEDQITYPIAAKLLSVPHVVDVRGQTMFGMSFIYVVFEEGTDLYWARSRVLEYLSGIRGTLPEGVQPVLGPDATGIGWVFQYALVDKSGKHGLDELRTLQDFTLKYALGSVPGVAEVASVGGYEKQYQVTVDPAKLRAFDVTLADMIGAIRNSNSDVGGRILELSGREYYVRGRGYIQDLGAVETVAVKPTGPSGVPVLVRDVGQVRFGPDIRRGLLEWNGEGEAVGAIVVARYGDNALDVIERVKKKLDELRPTLPEGVAIEVAYDRSGLIHRSVATLGHALVEEGLVVSLVIIAFLLHLRSSLLAILTLPLAVGLAFIPMALLGIPSTIMSLGGIAIAIGATVDAVIVMIEAAHKALEHAPPGADRRAVLGQAAREVTPAIFFSLVIIAVAFLPVFTLTGQAGRLFKPMAYTKTFVMLASALLSITFAPALRDWLIRGRIFPEHRHPVSRFIIRLYQPFVWVALRRPKTTLAIGLFALVSAVPLALELGHEFMPQLDEGDVLYMPITFPSISIEQAKQQVQAQDRILKGFPEVESVFGKVGRAETPTDPAPISMIETTVRLRPHSEWRKKDGRPMTREELLAEMSQHMPFPGWTSAWTMPIKTRVDMLSTGIRTPVGLKLYGTDLGEIEKAGKTLEHLLAPIRGTRSVLYERNLGGLYLDIVPKREALARYGLQVGDVEREVETAIGGTPISMTVEGRNRFSINVRYPQDLRGDVDRLERVLVPAPMAAGAPERTYIPLGQVADVRIVSGPPMIRDEGGLLTGYVYVDIDQAQRDLGGYVDEAKGVVARALAAGELTLKLPPKWTGQYEQLAEMTERMKLVIPITLVLIVLLLYWQFRDFTQALIVLLSIPFALVGSVWLMWLLDYRLSTAVWVGIIALVGLAAQTGIVMIVYIDHAYERRKRAGHIRDLDDIISAHMEGTVQRVRPKLMTVMTMLVGLVPLLWATGSGADVMRRIAAPMVGGLITSAFLTLEMIPVIVTYWRQEQLLHERLRELDPGRQRRMELLGLGAKLAAAGACFVAVSTLYLAWPGPLLAGVELACAVAFVGALSLYVALRPAARRQVWPG